MNYLETAPFEALDCFYFEEVVKQLPVSLRQLAVDLRVLRGSQNQQAIETLRHLYPSNYLFLPWILDDIFEIPATARLSIGQAYILLVIWLVITDYIVDHQSPQLPGIPLVLQQFLLKSGEIFSRQFAAPGPFWDHYYTCLAETAEALAIESDGMDAHTRPYTYEMMRQVCTGKAAALRVLAYALALASDRRQFLSALDATINNLVLADQLNDDALDWRADYQAGRYTLPVALALQAEGGPLEAGTTLSVEELGACLEQHGILAHMAEQAVAALKEACACLQEANLAQTKWSAFVAERLMLMERQARYYHTIRFLGGLIRAMDKSR
jgi:hypothetical protein